MTGDFTRNANLRFPSGSLQEIIVKSVGDGNAEFVSATRIATALMGDSIATNMFMLGFAYQRGLLPVSADAINKAIELNGAGVKMNLAAFYWGRRAAVDFGAVEKVIAPKAGKAQSTKISETLDELVARRIEFLIQYQDAAWAARYRKLVDEARAAETQRTPGKAGLAEAVARHFFKLMAYKDEYEVARLYTSGEFRDKLAAQFEGDYKLAFHLAPPLLSKRDKLTGEPKKSQYGAWMFPAFRVLAKLRFLRGGLFDIFGYAEERRLERARIGEYEATLRNLLARLDRDTHALCAQIAAIPEEIRGFGHVRQRHLKAAKAKEAELIAALRAPAAERAAA
jgi:indolepyruvate ferredoxin oxidoreductase